MANKLTQIFTLPDLRRKVLLTIVLLALTRVLAHIPLPGVDLGALANFFQKNQIFGLLNIFSGGAMQNFSLIMMGVGPYITASIIMQLLVVVIPSLEELSKEGEEGYHKINQYSRYLTVPLALLQSYGLLIILKGQGVFTTLSTFNLAITLIATTAGSILLMWIGEIIGESGIGNGISLIITLGIIAGMPAQIRNTAAVFNPDQLVNIIIFGAIGLIALAFIVIVTEGERQIPVYYARRVRGTQSVGGVETHLPLRVNTAGVIPIIFALSVMVFPGIVARFFSVARTAWIRHAALAVSNLFANNTFYATAYFFLVVIFTFFYTFVVFKPKDIAENLQKQGGFIAGIRPGNETKGYLSFVMNRITLAGALFLGIVAVLPFIAQKVTGVSTLVLGGTGILIIVSVILETMQQVNAALLVHTYGEYGNG